MSILSLLGLAPKNQPGIYRITNRRTGWFYIGATTLPITERWDRHRYLLRAGIHHNKRLQVDWGRYGPNAFRFSVVEVVQNTDQVFKREKYWQRLKHNDKCYNPHPDDVPDFIKRHIESSQRRANLTIAEQRAAIQRIYDLVPAAVADELTAWFRKVGYPEEVLPSYQPPPR